MPVIGLTGGIACGKSTVSQILRSKGADIIDADLISRQVMEPGTRAYCQIVKDFGTQVINGCGEIDRKKLGKIVYSDEKKRYLLNEITHGVIKEEIEKRIKTLLDQGHRFIIVDAPLLIEAGMMDMVDRVWLVTVPEEIQLERLMKRDHFSEAEARQHIDAQMPRKEKMNYADELIPNEESIDALELFLNDLIRREIGG